MGIKFANSAFATLASGINSSATSITLTTGQGARFPSLSAGDYFYATLIDTSNNLEIVKCTARSTDVLTVTRAQESTTARAFSTGDRIELRITAQGIADASGNLASGVLDIPGTSASGAIARLYEDTDNGTNYIGLKAPASVASNLDFTLPSTDGTNGQFLKTNGSGVLSFGTVAQKFVQVKTDQVTARTTGSTTWSTAPSATISTTLGNKFTEVSITPTSASNIIVVIAYCSVASETGNHSDYLGCGIWKNNTGTPLVAFYGHNTASPWIGSVDGANSGSNMLHQMYSETAGSTTARTYSWYAGVNGGSIVINGAGSGSYFSGSNVTFLMAMEMEP